MPRQWEPLCVALDMPDLLADEDLYWPAVRFDRADEIDARMNPWLAERTCADAVATLQEAGVPASRLLTMSEVLEDEQLAARHYWMAAPHLAAQAKHPCVPFRTDAGVSTEQLLRSAPKLGADTDVVLARIRDKDGGPRPELPAIDLSEVRMLEFGVAWAGPLAGRFLADLGVDVVMVEHPAARGVTQVEDPDAKWRWGELPPPHVRAAVYPNATPGERFWNREGIFNKMNRNKRSVCVDAKLERGAEILNGLLANSDLVLQNYSPRGAKSMGIDFASVRARNPSAVTVAMSGFGETGPLAGYLSYGPVLQAHGGFDAATGYEGGGPMRIGLAFPDAVGGVHGAFAALDALWEQKLRGGPVHVDVSQLETLLSIAGDMLLATSVTGCDPVRHGNRSPSFAVQGVYRCAGDDAWVAVSMRSVGTESCPAGLRADTSQEMDAALAQWASMRTPMDAATALQAAGVAAFPAMTNKAIVEDPHIRARGFIAAWDQVDVGPIEFPGFPIHFGGMEVEFRTCPGLGDDNTSALGERLGLRPDDVRALIKDGVLGERPPQVP
jgi:crotonobetainyl-CoA:carnitine CoA-transferase CaiB-like acyl-CoA transferase